MGYITAPLRAWPGMHSLMAGAEGRGYWLKNKHALEIRRELYLF
jgi:hypothetical protein